MTAVNANEVALGVESFGDDDAPLVLLAGGTTMLSWPDALCERLAVGGRRVVRYDLRDSGESTTADPEAPACVTGIGAWPSWLGVGPAGAGTSASLAARAVMASRSPSGAWRSSSVRSSCSSICSIPLLTSRSCPLMVFLGR
jgi:pimeloyl-ACP methyl ester carboxylesterase